MLKFSLGILCGLILASIPIYSLKTKVGHLEAVWLSCLNKHGIWFRGELYICSIQNTHFKQNTPLEE